jgi:hypothetical protein
MAIERPATEATQAATRGVQAAHVAPEGAASNPKATMPKKLNRHASKRARRKANPATIRKGAKRTTKPVRKISTTATGSKKQIVLDLLRRREGATTAEIAKATGWQHHSIRGFVSGTVAKKMGLTVESTRTENGERRYKIRTK